MLDCAAPENAGLFIGLKKFNTNKNKCGRKTKKRQLSSSKKKKIRQKKSTNQACCFFEIFLKSILVGQGKQFLYHRFVAVSQKLGGKFPVADDVLSFHKQEKGFTTSLDKSCM